MLKALSGRFHISLLLPHPPETARGIMGHMVRVQRAVLSHTVGLGTPTSLQPFWTPLHARAALAAEHPKPCSLP